MFVNSIVPYEKYRSVAEDTYYALRFKGKLGEAPVYTGRILLVGISYDEKTKEYRCKVVEAE